MRLKFTGDFRNLERFQRKVRAAPEILLVVSKNLSEEAVDLVRDGIERGVDPYGKKYDALKLRDGNPLEDSGRLKVWHPVEATKRGFSISSSADYARSHQEGTGIYGPRKQRIKPITARALAIPTTNGTIFVRSVKGTPQRMMVPRPGELPSQWRKRLSETAQEILEDHFK